jgi:hypothetical protein
MARKLRATASGPDARHGVRPGDDEIVVDDLNLLGLRTDSAAVQPLADPSTRSADGSVEVVFRHIERRLITELSSATIVVGCVAWLTSRPILEALAQTQGVSIVVQKEDFLRPDLMCILTFGSGPEPRPTRA